MPPEGRSRQRQVGRLRSDTHTQRGHDNPDSTDLHLIELQGGKDTGEAQRIPSPCQLPSTRPPGSTETQIETRAHLNGSIRISPPA